jgi:hypothetical protein
LELGAAAAMRRRNAIVHARINESPPKRALPYVLLPLASWRRSRIPELAR